MGVLAASTLMTMTDITIFHNPDCSNSRGALELLRARGLEPHIVDYLATPLTAAELFELIAHMGVPVRSVLRSKETLYQTLGLDHPACSDADLILALAQYPQLLNRPIVVTPKGAALCRPPEQVLSLL